MPKPEKKIVWCENCGSEFNVSKSFAKRMRYCPACSSALKRPVAEIQQNIKYAVASYIDAYGMEFVLDAIKSIKMEDGISASEALMREYYLNMDNA